MSRTRWVAWETTSTSSLDCGLKMPGFGWQEGYGAFTVSASSLDQVRTYVLRQEEHHRSTTFQQEFVAMVERGLVEYDERYLW